MRKRSQRLSSSVSGSPFSVDHSTNVPFLDPFEGVDLATVSDQTQKDVETMRKAAEAAETGQFNPAIDAADGAEGLSNLLASL